MPQEFGLISFITRAVSLRLCMLVFVCVCDHVKKCNVVLQDLFRYHMKDAHQGSLAIHFCKKDAVAHSSPYTSMFKLSEPLLQSKMSPSENRAP